MLKNNQMLYVVMTLFDDPEYRIGVTLTCLDFHLLHPFGFMDDQSLMFILQKHMEVLWATWEGDFQSFCDLYGMIGPITETLINRSEALFKDWQAYRVFDRAEESLLH